MQRPKKIRHFNFLSRCECQDWFQNPSEKWNGNGEGNRDWCCVFVCGGVGWSGWMTGRWSKTKDNLSMWEQKHKKWQREAAEGVRGYCREVTRNFRFKRKRLFSWFAPCSAQSHAGSRPSSTHRVPLWKWEAVLLSSRCGRCSDCLSW